MRQLTVIPITQFSYTYPTLHQSYSLRLRWEQTGGLNVSCLFQVIQIFIQFLWRMYSHTVSTTLHSSMPPHTVCLDKKKDSRIWAREKYEPVAFIRQWTYLHLIKWTSVYLDAETHAAVLALSATQNPSLPRSFISRGRNSQALPLLPLSCYQVWRRGSAGHTGDLQNVIQGRCSTWGLLGPVPKLQWCYLSFWRLTGIFWEACGYLVESTQVMTQYNPISMRTSVSHSPTPQILVVRQRCKLLLRTRGENKCKAVPGKASTD